MKLTSKETATVLAALRALQEDWKNVPSITRNRIQFREQDPLTLEEIDSLCERINCEARHNGTSARAGYITNP